MTQPVPERNPQTGGERQADRLVAVCAKDCDGGGSPGSGWRVIEEAKRGRWVGDGGGSAVQVTGGRGQAGGKGGDLGVTAGCAGLAGRLRFPGDL